jgi:2-aminoadipate transaminase
MRVGWLIGPADLVRKLAKIAEDTYVTPNMLSQGIAYEYLCSELLEPNITKLKELYLPRLDAMLAALEEHLPEARFARPEGGFFVGVTLTSGATMPALLIQAETAGIVLSDGRGFYPNDGGERFVRLPFCSLTTSEINEGIARLSWVLKNNSRGADT